MIPLSQLRNWVGREILVVYRGRHIDDQMFTVSWEENITPPVTLVGFTRKNNVIVRGWNGPRVLAPLQVFPA
jgi:hypothetical protein